MINLQPTKCNLCGGKVVYTSNRVIYGREYGSGKCYLCTSCKAYVGTHEPRPTEALGILGNKEMRSMKMKCHNLFDALWKKEPTSKKKHIARKNAYKMLAKKMYLPIEECHFGYFDLQQLQNAYEILKQGIEEEENVY